MRELMRIPGPPQPAGLGRKLAKAMAAIALPIVAVFGSLALLASGKQYPLTGPAHHSAQLKGAYHLHTSASDGSGELSEVVAAARRAGLDFIVVTDHNLAAIPPPSYQEGLLVIQGVEITTPWGHLVALGLPRPLTSEERSSAPIAAVRALGGLAFLAHPVQGRNPWRDWDAGVEATGLELYSGDTMLRETVRLPGRLSCAAGSYLGNRLHGLMLLVHPQPDTEAKLLQLSADEPKVALCALDAHGLPPYETEFRMLVTYLPAGLKLASDPLEAQRQVLGAIGAGDTYCGFEALGQAAGFSIEGLGSAREGKVGERLRLVLPPLGEAAVKVTVAGAASFEPDAGTVLLERPGPAQIQVLLLSPGCTFGEEWKPWIVPSPIRVVGTAQ